MLILARSIVYFSAIFFGIGIELTLKCVCIHLRSHSFLVSVSNKFYLFLCLNFVEKICLLYRQIFAGIHFGSPKPLHRPHPIIGLTFQLSETCFRLVNKAKAKTETSWILTFYLIGILLWQTLAFSLPFVWILTVHKSCPKNYALV